MHKSMSSGHTDAVRAVAKGRSALIADSSPARYARWKVENRSKSL